MDDDYTSQRLRNEPLVEITQVKGTSETHPALSNTDEWANFEIMPFVVATLNPSKPAGSYVRDALRRGLSLAGKGAGNPYPLRVRGRERHAYRCDHGRREQFLWKARPYGRRPRTARLDASSLLPVGPHEGCGPQSRDRSRRRRLHLCCHDHLRCFRSRRCLGRREHARGDLRCLPPQGNLCDLRPAHPGATLRGPGLRRNPHRRTRTPSLRPTGTECPWVASSSQRVAIDPAS